MAYSYYNYIGGEVAGRYMEQQIPFVGINHMETANRSVLTVNLEARKRLKYAYNSPIGPISILFDVSNIDKSLGVYFSLGKTF